MTSEFVVALAGQQHDRLSSHLTRTDGQEDVCFAIWRHSTGARRSTAIIGDPVLPGPDDRRVDRTAWFTGDYALRAAREAAAAGGGLALLHSHPAATSWQGAPEGSADAESERKIANLSREITGHPLVGMTLSTRSQTWSARRWDRGRGSSIAMTEAASVRVLSDSLRISYHPRLRAVPPPQHTQVRTVHSWGDEVQAHLTRLRILVVGAGSVGQLVLEMLARTGIEHVGIMDFDTVELLNLDRLHGATRLDAHLHTSKAELARRLATSAATAAVFNAAVHEVSICEAEGMRAALDYDVIFSCVDRPWPRHVVNTLAYADVIPVIDGGIRLEPAPHGGLRNAYWRSHTAGPGRACIRCLGQYDVADVQLERDGSLDDPSYIAGLPSDSPLRVRQNVYATSLAAASALTNQFLSLVIAPSGFGDPGPLKFDLRQHRLERVEGVCVDQCAYSGSASTGDRRRDATGDHSVARRVMVERRAAQRRPRVRFACTLSSASRWTEHLALRIAGQPT
jgi:hypothetical protein